MSGLDPTLIVERLARRLRERSVRHPVAGAIAQAARGGARLNQQDFAALLGVSASTVVSNEQGEVAFGDLLPQIGLAAASSGADLLALADLEAHWRVDPPEAAAGR